MGIDFNLVNNEIEKLNTTATTLNQAQTSTKWKEIIARYGDTEKPVSQFWDCLKNPTMSYDEQGWYTIKEFIMAAENIFLMFDPADEKKSFVFENGNALAEVLIESGCRDFYLVDDAISFLLCYNDHNIVLAAGTAKPWLAQTALEHTL
jgi:hypothetical protein